MCAGTYENSFDSRDRHKRVPCWGSVSADSLTDSPTEGVLLLTSSLVRHTRCGAVGPGDRLALKTPLSGSCGHTITALPSPLETLLGLVTALARFRALRWSTCPSMMAHAEDAPVLCRAGATQAWRAPWRPIRPCSRCSLSGTRETIAWGRVSPQWRRR